MIKNKSIIRNSVVLYLVLLSFFNVSCKKEEIKKDDNVLSIVLLPPVQIENDKYLLKGMFVSPGKFKVKEYGFRVANLGKEEYLKFGEWETPGTIKAEYNNSVLFGEQIFSMYAIRENGDTLTPPTDYKIMRDYIHDSIPVPVQFTIHYPFSCTINNLDVAHYTVMESGYDYSFASTYTGTLPDYYVFSNVPNNSPSVYMAIDASYIGDHDIYSQYYYKVYALVRNNTTGTITKLTSILDDNF